MAKKKLTSAKAKEILHDKEVHGNPLTDKQRRFFGAIAGGAPIKAEQGGWLDKYDDGGTMQEYQENYNDNFTSLPPDFVGMGNDITGRDYSPAWGGQFQKGGTLPPIYTDDPRKVQAYQDSLLLYNATKGMNKNLQSINNYQNFKNYIDEWFDKYGKKFSEASKRLKNPKPIEEVEKQFSQDERGFSVEYKKPVQPYILQDDPKPKSKKYWTEKDVTPEGWKLFKSKYPDAIGIDPNHVDREGNHLPILKTTPKPEPRLVKQKYTPEEITPEQQHFGIPQLSSIPIPPQRENNYRVEYRDESGNLIHRDFPNEKIGTMFQQSIPGERTGYYTKFQDGGNLQPPMAGANQTVSMAQNGKKLNTPEKWEKAIREVEHKIGNPDQWTIENYNELQNKLNEYKSWRENTPKGKSVIDYHNEPNEYIVPLPMHLRDKNSLKFLEPNDPKLPKGYIIPYNTPSSELATSIGGEGGEPAYLIPSFKYGKPLEDPYKEFLRTGEHLGGPFKTWQEADEWERNIRHPYVEKGLPIPTPIKRWGKDFAMGGSLPGATGFMYARTGAPSNGKYAKKTLPSAQNGIQTFYQHGLDWKPKMISEDGSVIKDNKGQWNHPGEITEIQGNTMATHGYGDIPLYVVPDVGEPRVVEANTGTHTFPGATKFTEYPINKKSNKGWLDKYN